MDNALFSNHIMDLRARYSSALEHLDNTGIESVLIHSGSQEYYFADDRGIQFQAYGHFLHWLPINQPDQFLLFRQGEKPRYIQYIPADFWHDQNTELADWWADAFDIVTINSLEDIQSLVQAESCVFMGQDEQKILRLLGQGISCNPSRLLSYLDYHRAYKSEYEINQLRLANEKGLLGHNAAIETFQSGGNEYDIHQAYLNACQVLEYETPYTNIVALNEKSAILHYQQKRSAHNRDNKVLLVDAGYRLNNYGSDITRTSVTESAHPVFKALLAEMEAIELSLVDAVQPGMSYVELHDLTLEKISAMLCTFGIMHCDVNTMLENRFTQLFMPHGVGHLLGIQVHDVGGFQQDSNGTTKQAPDYSPTLRNTRLIENSMVFTIEPGCYFIPMLLEPMRESKHKALFEWSLIDELYSNGGIRIEDNILVTADGAENLTRGDG